MVRQTPVTNHNVNALKVHPYNADSVFRCGREHTGAERTDRRFQRGRTHVAIGGL